jgi:hypothetical protein
MCLRVSYKKNCEKFFFASLPDPLVRGTDPRSGSAQKCHGSPTLLISRKSKVADTDLYQNLVGRFFCIFFAGLEYVGHSFAYVAHFVFLGDVWIRTQRAAVACTNATHLP